MDVMRTCFVRRPQGDYFAGAAHDLLTEKNLRDLYGASLKRLAIEFTGRSLETIAPMLTPVRRAAVREVELERTG